MAQIVTQKAGGTDAFRTTLPVCRYAACQLCEDRRITEVLVTGAQSAPRGHRVDLPQSHRDTERKATRASSLLDFESAVAIRRAPSCGATAEIGSIHEPGWWWECGSWIDPIRPCESACRAGRPRRI